MGTQKGFGLASIIASIALITLISFLIVQLAVSPTHLWIQQEQRMQQHAVLRNALTAISSLQQSKVQAQPLSQGLLQPDACSLLNLFGSRWDYTEPFDPNWHVSLDLDPSGPFPTTDNLASNHPAHSRYDGSSIPPFSAELIFTLQYQKQVPSHYRVILKRSWPYAVSVLQGSLVVAGSPYSGFDPNHHIHLDTGSTIQGDIFVQPRQERLHKRQAQAAKENPDLNIIPHSRKVSLFSASALKQITPSKNNYGYTPRIYGSHSDPDSLPDLVVGPMLSLSKVIQKTTIQSQPSTLPIDLYYIEEPYRYQPYSLQVTKKAIPDYPLPAHYQDSGNTIDGNIFVSLPEGTQPLIELNPTKNNIVGSVYQLKQEQEPELNFRDFFPATQAKNFTKIVCEKDIIPIQRDILVNGTQHNWTQISSSQPQRRSSYYHLTSPSVRYKAHMAGNRTDRGRRPQLQNFIEQTESAQTDPAIRQALQQTIFPSSYDRAIRNLNTTIELNNCFIFIDGDLNLTSNNGLGGITGSSCTLILNGNLTLEGSELNSGDQGMVIVANKVILKSGGTYRGLILSRSSVETYPGETPLTIIGGLVAGNGDLILRNTKVIHDQAYLDFLNGYASFRFHSIEKI